MISEDNENIKFPLCMFIFRAEIEKPLFFFFFFVSPSTPENSPFRLGYVSAPGGYKKKRRGGKKNTRGGTVSSRVFEN